MTKQQNDALLAQDESYEFAKRFSRTIAGTQKLYEKGGLVDPASDLNLAGFIEARSGSIIQLKNLIKFIEKVLDQSSKKMLSKDFDLDKEPCQEKYLELSRWAEFSHRLTTISAKFRALKFDAQAEEKAAEKHPDQTTTWQALGKQETGSNRCTKIQF